MGWYVGLQGKVVYNQPDIVCSEDFSTVKSLDLPIAPDDVEIEPEEDAAVQVARQKPAPPRPAAEQPIAGPTIPVNASPEERKKLLKDWFEKEISKAIWGAGPLVQFTDSMLAERTRGLARFCGWGRIIAKPEEYVELSTLPLDCKLLEKLPKDWSRAEVDNLLAHIAASLGPEEGRPSNPFRLRGVSDKTRQTRPPDGAPVQDPTEIQRAAKKRKTTPLAPEVVPNGVSPPSSNPPPRDDTDKAPLDIVGRSNDFCTGPKDTPVARDEGVHNREEHRRAVDVEESDSEDFDTGGLALGSASGEARMSAGIPDVRDWTMSDIIEDVEAPAQPKPKQFTPALERRGLDVFPREIAGSVPVVAARTFRTFTLGSPGSEKDRYLASFKPSEVRFGPNWGMFLVLTTGSPPTTGLRPVLACEV